MACDHVVLVEKGRNKPKEKMDLDRIRLAINGDDPAAFRELYNTYGPDLRYGVRRFIRKVPRLKPHQEDIMSRAWERLLGRERKLLRSFDPGKGTFTYFIRLVGANTAWQEADRRGQPSLCSADVDVERMTSDSNGGDIERLIADRELLSQVDARLRKDLSERDLMLLEQVFILRRSAKEVAELLDMSVEAVWAATTRLRKKLEPVGKDLECELSEGGESPASGPKLVVAYLMFRALGALDDARSEDEPCSVMYQGEGKVSDG